MIINNLDLESIMRLPTGTYVVDLSDPDDDDAPVWRVTDAGLEPLGGGAVEWSWRALALNGGPSASLTVVC